MTPVEENSQTEEYFHKLAWRVVNRQIEGAEKNPMGALYDDLVAMVFAFHTFEGYLNFVGEKIAAELWAKERETFGQTGIMGKLDAICKKCGIQLPIKGRRPLQTILKLTKFRDMMVHPKIFRESKNDLYKDAAFVPNFPETPIGRMVTHENAVRARDDVKHLVDAIHEAARKRFPCAGLGQRALEGITYSRTASISPIVRT